VTRVPETSRGGHARLRQERASQPSLERPGPRNLLYPRKWNAPCESRGVQRAARRPSTRQRVGRANATGIGWCQRVAGRKPHSRARNDSSFGCARASTSVAEVGERRSGSEKRDPAGKRARGREPGFREGPQGPFGRSTASTTGTAVAKPRSRERPEPGVRKDVAGQRFSLDGRHPGSFLRWLVHASRLKAASAALEMIRERANGHAIEGEATGVSEARYARITTGRQRPSR
jgi:hypothetical protein